MRGAACGRRQWDVQTGKTAVGISRPCGGMEVVRFTTAEALVDLRPAICSTTGNERPVSAITHCLTFIRQRWRPLSLDGAGWLSWCPGIGIDILDAKGGRPTGNCC